MRIGSIRPRRSLSIFCFLIGFILGWLFLGGNEKAEMEDIQMAENWERKLVEQKPQQPQQQLGAKVYSSLNFDCPYIRIRFSWIDPVLYNPN
jgi:hypothetical protein